MQPANLTEKRKADREQMLARLQAIIAQHGATVDVDRPDPRTIMLRIEGARGLCAYVELSGESCQSDTHVIPWHLVGDGGEKLSPRFGDVNPYHFRKSTQVAYGSDALFANVDRALRMAADGSAFQ